MAAIRECRVPVDGCGEPRVDVGERVGDDVCRGERDAIPARTRRGRRVDRPAGQRIVGEPAVA